MLGFATYSFTRGCFTDTRVLFLPLVRMTRLDVWFLNAVRKCHSSRSSLEVCLDYSRHVVFCFGFRALLINYVTIQGLSIVFLSIDAVGLVSFFSASDICAQMSLL